MTNRHPHLLDRNTSVLVVVDMQEPFLGAIHERERLTENVRLLCRTAGILSIPVIPTLQYASRMGRTVDAIAEVLPTGAGEIDKMCFSCGGAAEFRSTLAATGRAQVVLCGVETHICVAQTALDLLHADFQVHVAADAVSSRTLEKHKLGMERIRDSGALPCAAESAVYEWLYEAGTPEFKEILRLVR